MIKIQNISNLSTVSGKSIHSLAMLLGNKFLFKNPYQFLKYKINKNNYDLNITSKKLPFRKQKFYIYYW